MVGSGTSGIEIDGVTTIDAETAKELHDRGVLFIDVWANWHHKRIPRAYLLSIWFFDFNEVTLPRIADKTQEVVLYSSGEFDGTLNWGQEAVARAVIWGFEKVYYFPRGLRKWEAAGYLLDADTK